MIAEAVASWTSGKPAKKAVLETNMTAERPNCRP